MVGFSPLMPPISRTKEGQIQVIFGPMFSGKTTELIRRCKRYQIAGYCCVVVKYANDTRYTEDSVATHDRQTLAAVSAVELLPMLERFAEYDVIGIDEGQFFPDVVSCAERLGNQGKIVIVAALDGTYQRKGFGDILQLVPLAENVIKLTAVCMKCSGEAAFTKRTSADVELEVIGGSEIYKAVCRKCHSEMTPRKRRVELIEQNTTNSDTGLMEKVKRGDLF